MVRDFSFGPPQARQAMPARGDSGRPRAHPWPMRTRRAEGVARSFVMHTASDYLRRLACAARRVHGAGNPFAPFSSVFAPLCSSTSHPFFLSLARGRPKVEPKVSHSASCAPRGCSVPDWSQTRRFRLEVRPGLPRRPHASTIPREHPHRARRALANQHGAPLASDGKVHAASGRGSWGAGPSPSVPCRLAPPTRPPLSLQAIRRIIVHGRRAPAAITVASNGTRMASVGRAEPSHRVRAGVGRHYEWRCRPFPRRRDCALCAVRHGLGWTVADTQPLRRQATGDRRSDPGHDAC